MQPGQTDLQAVRSAVQCHIESCPGGAHDHVADKAIRRFFSEGDRDPFSAVQFIVQPFPVFIIHIDDGGLVRCGKIGKKLFLCLIIGFHGAVIVQMVAGQIGKDGAGIFCVAAAALRQTVTGTFHCHKFRAVLLLLLEQSLQRGGVRHGVDRGCPGAVADIIEHSGQQSAFSSA